MPSSSYRGIYAVCSFVEIITAKVMQRHLSSLHWVVAAGILAGLLLMPLAPVLPERVQSPSLYGGIALSLVCLAAALVHLARDAQLQWRGISPVVGILIGALAFLGPVGWRYVAGRHSEAAQMTAPTVPAVVHATTTLPRKPASQIAQTQQSARPYPPTNEERLDRMLLEVSDILTGKARRVTQAVSIMVRVREPTRLRSALAVATTGLADVKLSINRTRSENTSLAEQLDTVLGDLTPLSELDSALQQFSDSQQSMEGESANQTGRAGPPSALTQPVWAATGSVSRWITDCQQRIAALRASVATPP
jgi:hypothetical protein